MASRNLYSPKYDNKGNVKPSIPELTNAVENARIDAEDYKNQSQTARDDARAARDEALAAANDLGALGGVDGTAENKTGSSTLEKADGTTVDASNHSGEIWYVVGETAYYESDGTDWIQTGPDLSDASRLTKGALPTQTIPQSALAAGHIVSVPDAATADVFITANFSTNEDAVQAAINAANNGGGRVLLPEGLLPFDGSSVSFDSSVRMAREGQPQGYDVLAYGATADGSDDLPAFEAARDAAVANGGGKIIIPSRTFHLSGQLTTTTTSDPIEIIGITGNEIRPVTDGSEHPYFRISDRDTVRNLNIDARRSSNTSAQNDGSAIFVLDAQDVLVENCVIENPVSDGVYVNGESDDRHAAVKISNVTVRNAGRQGISYVGGDGIIITGCDTKGSEISGIDAEVRAASDSIVRGVRITGNYISNSGGAGMRVQSVNREDTEGFVVANNVIYSPGDHGIFVNRIKGLSLSANTVIMNNTGKNGVKVINATGSEINNNVIRDSPSNGVFIGDDCKHVGVSSNTILGSGGNGIKGRGSGRRKKCKVTANTIKGFSDTGVRMNECDDWIVSHNQIESSESGTSGVVSLNEATNQTTKIAENKIYVTDDPSIYSGDSEAEIYRNEGFVTEDKGTEEIPSGSTTVTVGHDLDLDPSKENFQVTPVSSLGAASEFFVDNVNPESFDINLDADPTQSVTFSWMARITSE